MDYKIIVVGGGHAGCEASLAAARMGEKTLLVTGNIKNIWDKLGEIIGVSYENELIDTLFSQFCLGK